MSLTFNQTDDFVPAKRLASRNLKNKKFFVEQIDSRFHYIGRIIQIISSLPYCIEEVFIRGYRHLPLLEEPAAILSFSHKKIHDIFALSTFMLGRPMESFHNFTTIAQGGLFCGIFAYRDIVPQFMKKGYLKYAMAPLARFLGKITKWIFVYGHAHPAFREGSDVPANQEDYNDPHFAGPLIMGMEFDEFLKYTSRQTINSVIQVQKEIEKENRTFAILPEGGYHHSGATAELHDLLCLTSYRKQRPIINVSISYDELCRDSLYRIPVWMNISEPLSPPTEKNGMQDLKERSKNRLQNTTTILTSHLIALSLKNFLLKNNFSASELETSVQTLAAEAISSPFPCDSNLQNDQYVALRIKRFMRHYQNKWFSKKNGYFIIRHETINRFKESGRITNDIEWNCNNVTHFSEWLERKG